MSKGSNRRPKDVSEETFTDNWNRVFKSHSEVYQVDVPQVCRNAGARSTFGYIPEQDRDGDDRERTV